MKENENYYLVYVHKDEYAEVLHLLDKMRTEKARQQAIEEQKQQIEAAIEIAISVIGLEETKRIVRKASRDLRSKTDDPCDNCEQCIEMRNGIHAKCPKTDLFDVCEKHPFLIPPFSCLAPL